MMSSEIHPRRFWPFALVITLVLGLLGVLGVTASQAAVGDEPVATWNMFGANSPDADKWRVGVAWLANRADVVALQEAGARPPGTVVQVIDQNNGLLVADNYDQRPVVRPPGVGGEVTHTIWQYGGGEVRHVYWLATDRSAQGNGWTSSVGHVNLAIVSRFPADDVVIIPNTIANAGGNKPYSQRAALGIRIGDTWYFTLHGMSGSGNDDYGLLQNIREFIADRPLSMGTQHWIALGDYNRLPGNLSIPPGTVMYNSGQPTHGLVGQGSGAPAELDYGVGTYPSPGTQVGRITDNAVLTLSDHVPVYVGQLRAAAQPRPLLTNHTVVENMQAGGVLDAEHEHTSAGTPIVSYAHTGGGNQTWDVEVRDQDATARIRSWISNLCIGVAPPISGAQMLLASQTQVSAGAQLRLYDCADDDSQFWSLESVGNEQWQFHSQLQPDLCMNVRGGQTDPTQAKYVILWACQNTANERFILTTADSSSSYANWEWEPNDAYGFGPYSLENLGTGGNMDVYHERTANNSDVISWQRTGRANQGWWLEWKDEYTVSFQGVGSHRCLDIYNSTDHVGPDRHLVVWDCTGQASQRWLAVRLNNGQIQWRNQLYSDLCLDVADRGHDPQTINNPGALITQNCRLDWTTQQWSFTPFDQTGTPTPEADWDWDGDNPRVGLVIPNPGPPAHRVGYFNSWSIYANDFTVKDLDTRGIAGKLTQLNYAGPVAGAAVTYISRRLRPGTSIGTIRVRSTSPPSLIIPSRS